MVQDRKSSIETKSQLQHPAQIDIKSPEILSKPSSPKFQSCSWSPTSPNQNEPNSPTDSKIPRPFLSSLKRCSSLKIRGERVLRSSGCSTPNFCHQRHHHHDLFPAITENSLEPAHNRSLSLSLTPARPRSSGTTHSEQILGDDSDLESVRSYGSTASACDHAHFALNGTTWSGRSKKYVVHCSKESGEGELYLTPTQRAVRQVRKLQNLVNEAKKEIELKDSEIVRLTKEVVELRLFKASLNSPDDKTDSSDALTVRENNLFSPQSPSTDLPQEISSTISDQPSIDQSINQSASLADSGHFEDDSVHSKDSSVTQNQYQIQLNQLYEQKMEEIHRRHLDEIQEMKQKHNDKMESLLNQLSEVNSCLCELRPALDAAEKRVKQLEIELKNCRGELAEQKTLFEELEERNKQMYLKMYNKGQEAAKMNQADQMYHHGPETSEKVSITELLKQLSVTQAELDNLKGSSYLPQLHISVQRSHCLLTAQEAVSLWVLATRKAMYRRLVESRNQTAIDPEITLQFLKSAIYYFLTDKENHLGHLNAIESILGFSETEKSNIDRIYGSTRK